MSHKHEPDEFIDEIRSKQRNIVFPDTVRNERGLYDFLWNGTPDPPMVQRIGAWMMGLFLVIAGLFPALMAPGGGNWIDYGVMLLISLPLIAAGIRIFRNGFPRKRR